MAKSIGDIVIPIIFSLAIVVSMGVDMGTRYGIRVGFIYVLIFSFITGSLCLLGFVTSRPRL